MIYKYEKYIHMSFSGGIMLNRVTTQNYFKQFILETMFRARHFKHCPV